MRIAVIGTGISGLSAAWLLREKHDVTVYEQDRRPGGHSNTITVDYDGVPIDADTGFMVYNELTYPHLVAMFDHLGVRTKPSNMSFSVSIDRGRIEYAGTNMGTVFAQKRNLVRPSFLRMLLDIKRFNDLGVRYLEQSPSKDLTIGGFLDQIGTGSDFKNHYLLPMAGSIWSSPTGVIERFPAHHFLRFFANHGLLSVNEHPPWRTVDGGSKNYVGKLCRALDGRIKLNCPVVEVRRGECGVQIIDGQGGCHRFDAVVMAAHSDQTLAILTDATRKEQHLLGSIRYQTNHAVIHRDPSLMPVRRKVWSSWNYQSPASMSAQTDQPAASAVSLTYWMNQLQAIDERYPLFVSINPELKINPKLIFDTVTYAHPVFDQAAIDAQDQINDIQGQGGVWYAGAWMRYGFHEDGMRAGIQAAQALGARLPWDRRSAIEAPASVPDLAAAVPER